MNNSYFNTELRKDAVRIIRNFKENTLNLNNPYLKATKNQDESLEEQWIIDVDGKGYFYHNQYDRDTDFYFLNKELSKIKKN